MSEYTAIEIIRELREKGVTKWAIKKRLRVHWNTVNQWSKGNFPPTKEHLDELMALLLETRQSQQQIAV
jgi:transposase-like protein